jgi:hypothetical protein
MENIHIYIMANITNLIDRHIFNLLNNKGLNLWKFGSFFCYNIIVSEEYSGALVQLCLRKGGISYDTSR